MFLRSRLAFEQGGSEQISLSTHLRVLQGLAKQCKVEALTGS